MKQSIYLCVEFETILNIKMKLSRKVLEILLGSKAIQGKIADLTDKSFITIQRWIEANDDELTKLEVLNLIKKETGLSDKEMFETEKESAGK